MSNKKITHYDIRPLKAIEADYYLAWGEKGNGKSYQGKHEIALKDYLEKGERFIYLRRWKEEITTDKVERYFADVDVNKLTNGKYNCIMVYRKQLFFATYDIETTKTVRGEKIGYVMALSTEQNYSGCSYLDVKNILFEEFMSRSDYIPNEPDRLMFLYSTVDRKRRTTKLWLLGNTVSRVCPYIQEWGLQKIISTQKQGTIETTEISAGFDDDGNEVMIKLAIEYCKSTGVSSFVIGHAKEMINGGSWQSSPQPHLPKSYSDYEVLFRCMFLYKSFKFAAEYLLDKDGYETCWFIYPYNGKIDDKTIVFSDIIKVSKYWQRDIYNTDFNNQKLNDLFKTFRETNIFYASDLCGTDFKQAIDFTIRK